MDSIAIKQTGHKSIKASGTVTISLPATGTYNYNYSFYDSSSGTSSFGSSLQAGASGGSNVKAMAANDYILITYRRLT